MSRPPSKATDDAHIMNHSTALKSTALDKRYSVKTGTKGGWILALCAISVLFATRSSQQLTSMRAIMSAEEDAYQHGVAVRESVVRKEGNFSTRSITYFGGDIDDHGEVKKGFVDDRQADGVDSATSEDNHKNGPWVAQLLAYPSSGTSYTLFNTRRLNNLTTATASGQEVPSPPIPLRADLGYSSPYLVRPDLKIPGLVLTKSHCGGYCFKCRPATSSKEFELQCRTAARMDGTVYRQDVYGAEMVKKRVHLIRDPFDNCVSRMHQGLDTMPLTDLLEQLRTAIVEDPVSALKQWCAYLDESFQALIPKYIWDRDDVGRLLSTPCHVEFIRYVSWHNAALNMTRVQQPNIPVYRLFYENYTANFGGVVRELYEEFLRYPPIKALPKLYFPEMTYHYLFSPEHQQEIAYLIESLASPELWQLLKHYFSGIRTFNFTSDGVKRSIALLLSFPNSGTSYTINNVMQISSASAGTNYGGEIKGSVIQPVVAELTNGPWALLPHCNDPTIPELPSGPGVVIPHCTEPLPKVVLTKTHCTGYCDNCMKLVVSPKEFDTGCHETFHHQLQEHYNYTHSIAVDRAVHIFRSPFDNLVSRKHLGVHSRVASDPSFAKMLEDTREALLSWCNYTDSVIINNPDAQGWSNLSSEIQTLFATVPCSVEMFRLVQWHNLAVDMTIRKRIPAHYIYYEDYESNFNATVDDLIHFLELEARNVSLPFEGGKRYDGIFDDDHSRALAQFVKAVATPECWRHLSYYFYRWLNDGKGSYNGISSTTNLSTNDMKQSVVWLLSFPNSGTTYTIANVERMSNHTAAVNYKREADGVVPVNEEYPEGPFIHNRSLSVPRLVLTKTHCDGYCDDCTMQRSFMSINGFEAGCGRSERVIVRGTIVNPPYPSSVPVKVVHLIRSPWDNVVSRMHHGIYRRRTFLNWTEQELAPFQNSIQGVSAWCRYIDNGFWDATALNVSGLGVDDLHAITSVPCGPDFFRYVQWHNNAIALSRSMGVPTRIVFYEDYTTQLNETTQDLLEFLDLPAVSPPLPFTSGKTYDDLMDRHDRRKAWELIRRFAKPELWQLLKRYGIQAGFSTDADVESSQI